MSPALILALVLAAALLVALVAAVLLGRAARASRADHAGQLRASQEAIAALQARVDALAAATPEPGRSADYLITTMADGTPDPAAGSGGRPAPVALSGREFTSVAVGESVVRIASLAHGVRRALSPGTRARIRFEMRQELKRTRRQRRQDLRSARRHLRIHGQPVVTRDRDAA